MPPKPKGQNPLTRKLGPAPVWVWLAAAAGAYLVYRAYASRGASSAVAQTTPNAGGDTGSGGVPSGGGGGIVGAGGDTSGTGGGAGTAAPDSAFQAFSDLVAQLEGQNAQLTSSLLDQQVNAATNPTAAQLPPSSSIVSSTAAPVGFPSDMSQAAPAPVAQPAVAAPAAAPAPAPFVWQPVAASNPNFAATALAQTQAAPPKAALPFGGVVSTRTLANGATLTTYASGRQVEQAPGHSAYVVHA